MATPSSIDRPLEPPSDEVPLLDGEVLEIEIEASDPEDVLEYDFGEPDRGEPAHDDNLAEYMDERDLQSLGNQLVTDFRADKNSRKDWERAYKEGLKLLGIKKEDRTEPWDGACGVFHPMLSEAVINFQSQTIQEIFPAKGPVKTKIIGRLDPEKTKQAERVREYMNHLLTEEMTEYRPETERLLFSLPLIGSAFRKIYYDPLLGRPCSVFVPAEDFVVNYAESDIRACERMTHVMKRTPNWVRKMQVNGYYRDVDLGEPQRTLDDIDEEEAEITGISMSEDHRHTLLEMVVDLDLPGFEDTYEGEPTGIALPYVVTVDLGSAEVLSIRRNWYEDDDLKKRRDHYAHYVYVPGLGFYGFGLIHLIGGMADASTSIIRQLVDAGTLSNLPGGLKTQGLRIVGDDTPIAPGEWRDVSVPAGAIRDNLLPLPYKEPSQVLYSLLNTIVEEGRRFASQADLKAADMNNEAPVGTTLALLERSLKVVTALQARLHASQKHEFQMISRVVADYGPNPDHPAVLDGELSAGDFDARIDVVPVSNPGAGTMAQRIMQAQAALQLAQQAPQLYNLPLLHRQMLEALEIPDVDEVVPLESEVPPTDPVAENMRIITSEPVKAYLYQDHDAHIAAHMAFAQDPSIQQMLQNSPQAQAILAAGEAHIREHIAMKYYKDIEKQLGFELPDPEEGLPEDIEFRLSQLVAPAAEKLLQKDVAEQQRQEYEQTMQDPVFQQRERELDIEEQNARNDHLERMAKIEADREKNRARITLDREKFQHQRQKDAVQSVLDAAEIVSDAETERLKIEAKQETEGLQAGVEIMRELRSRQERNRG